MPQMFGLFLKKLTQVSGQLKQLNWEDKQECT